MAVNRRNGDNQSLTISQTKLYNESQGQSDNNADQHSDSTSHFKGSPGGKGNYKRLGSKNRRKSKKMIVKVPKVDTEESLAVALMMVKNEIHDDKFNASRRRILLTFLQSVDFKAINMTQSTWEDLITALSFIAN